MNPNILEELIAAHHAACAERDALKAEVEALRESRNGWVTLCKEAQAERDALKAELEKSRIAASVLCGAHIGLPQERCPVCERDALKAEVERLRADNESLRQQIDPESIQHWDTMRAQRDKAQAEIVSLLKGGPDPDWLVWFCKIAAPRSVVGPLPQGSDAPMRFATRAAFARVTGVDDLACFSGWNGSFTPGEREIVEPCLRAALRGEEASNEE